MSSFVTNYINPTLSMMIIIFIILCIVVGVYWVFRKFRKRKKRNKITLKYIDWCNEAIKGKLTAEEVAHLISAENIEDQKEILILFVTLKREKELKGGNKKMNDSETEEKKEEKEKKEEETEEKD